MRWNRIHNALCLFGLFTIGCIEPYTLEGVKTDPQYLVVDGFIDASESTCAVRLSRAVSLNTEHVPPGEVGASVSVKSEDGEEFFLAEVEAEDTGLYLADDVSVVSDKSYKLYIVLGNGSHYESDFIRIERAAEIESLIWEPEAEDVKIRISTVPNTSSTQFYRWRFEETWQYNAPRASSFIIRDGMAQLREPHERVYTCYRTEPSYNILIGSSQHLASNVVQNYVVQSIPTSSIKISAIYNIRVGQYALSEEAYTFWLNLYKTTESTGGLFDPMPGQVIGNIKGVTNPSEPVVGYFSGSTVEEASVWIRRSDFAAGYVRYRTPFCAPDTLAVDQIAGLPERTPLIDAIYGPFGSVVGYTFGSPSCVDCRIYGGGTTTKPEFWP